MILLDCKRVIRFAFLSSETKIVSGKWISDEKKSLRRRNCLIESERRIFTEIIDDVDIRRGAD